MSENPFDDCEHGSLPTTCPVCLGPAPKPPAPERLFSFSARYDGQCPECNLPITPGQMASRWSDEFVRHMGCEA